MGLKRMTIVADVQWRCRSVTSTIRFHLRHAEYLLQALVAYPADAAETEDNGK